MWVWITRRAYLGLYKTYITLPAETGLIVLIIIVDRVISLRISCGIGHITLSSLTALEELVCCVLGDLLQEGIVTKLADGLYYGGNTHEELFNNWEKVLQAFSRCALRLRQQRPLSPPALQPSWGGYGPKAHYRPVHTRSLLYHHASAPSLFALCGPTSEPTRY